MNDLKLGVGILFFNKVDQTVECIQSVAYPNVPLYIFNNGSDGVQREELGRYCEAFENIAIIDSESNLGVGMGRNALFEATCEDWLFFIDNDIVVKTADWFEVVAGHIQAEPEIEAFIPKIYNAHEGRYIRPVTCTVDAVGKVSFPTVASRYTNIFPGGASVVSRRLFQRLGAYDEQMFIEFEDFEMAIRAIKAQAPIKACIIDDLEMVHQHRRLTRQADCASVYVRYNYETSLKSYERIAAKHQAYLDRNFGPWLEEQIDHFIVRVVKNETND